MSPLRFPALRVPTALLFAAGAAGCSAEIEQYTTDADTGSTHALISIQRRASVDPELGSRADALASFVRVPADVESKTLFELLGLRGATPAPGQCQRRSSDLETRTPLSSLGRLELLEAGDVTLLAAGSETALAPHAFPSVTDLISGVVYATRDRSAAPLPAATPYLVRASGEGALGAVVVAQQAPPELDSVTVGGTPLGDVEEVSISLPLDLTWSVGHAGDLVLVELTTTEGAAATVCAFRDDAGAGSVPARTFANVGQGRLSVHRLRSSTFSGEGVDVGELTFDFELAAAVTFAQ